jgi:WD40 repeat protein
LYNIFVLGPTLTSWACSAAFSPDGERIVSGSRDSTIRLWNAQTGKAIGEPFMNHTSKVHSVAFFPDGESIVSGSQDNTIILWNAQTGEDTGKPLKGHAS